MFSGIVTDCLAPLSCLTARHLLRVTFPKSSSFKTLNEGDSVSVDGVCLTIEVINKNKMSFCIGPETLRITGWTAKDLQKRKCNLEPSLKFNSSLGGHPVTGHVDGIVQLISIEKKGESREMNFRLPKGFQKFFWKKSYIALNGVSLTVNDKKGTVLKVCLIPKTLGKTNLSFLKAGDLLNFEVDRFARTLIHALENTKIR